MVAIAAIANANGRRKKWKILKKWNNQPRKFSKRSFG